MKWSWSKKNDKPVEQRERKTSITQHGDNIHKRWTVLFYGAYCVRRIQLKIINGEEVYIEEYGGGLLDNRVEMELPADAARKIAEAILLNTKSEVLNESP